MPNQYQTHTRRRGVSSFQVLTFLLVSGMGVWLGAEYVGVDVEHLAYTALDETHLIDRVPEQWRPAPPPSELGDGEGQISFEERAAELRSELQSLRTEVAAIRNEAVSLADDGRVLPGAYIKASTQTRQATLAFWTRLRQIAAEVSELHDAVEPALQKNSASEVFDIRRRAFEYGARAVESVDLTDVDEQAVRAGYRISNIYSSGADLYGRASAAWEGRVDLNASGPIERSLEHAKEQHTREVELVREQTARTELILMRRYAVEFPEVTL